MKRLLSAVVIGITAVTATSVTGQAATPTSGHALTGSISIVYSESYEFDAKNLADTWWSRVK